MVTRSVLQRTFYIKYQVSDQYSTLGTAFTFEINNVQYLATTSHSFTFTEHCQELDILIMRNNEWETIHSKIFKHPKKAVDICILALPNDLSPRHFVEMTDKGVQLGQDTFFLGFPYGKFMDVEINNDYPIPFVKKGIFSSILIGGQNPPPDVYSFYLDAMNNPGFSGGPCCFIPAGKNLPAICGIIKGYHPHEIEVKTPLGNYTFEENSGLVEVHSIHHLFEIPLD
ncbi:serine protease family protein [Ferruginibacter sp.]